MSKGARLLVLAAVGLVMLAGIAALLRPAVRLAFSSNATPVAEAAPIPAPASQAKPAKPAPVSTPSPAAEGPFVIKRILPIKGPIKYGEWHWDETGVPKGPIVITVDLEARVLSVFRDGYEIGATAVLLGTQDHPTPTGVFPIMSKERMHHSNLYYDAPMPFMQRLTNDGVTLHATKVEWGYASHGCIGMPEPFAAKLYGITKVGDKVYITRGKMVGLGDLLVRN